jgi:hypothetical protein
MPHLIDTDYVADYLNGYQRSVELIDAIAEDGYVVESGADSIQPPATDTSRTEAESASIRHLLELRCRIHNS